MTDEQMIWFMVAVVAVSLACGVYLGWEFWGRGLARRTRELWMGHQRAADFVSRAAVVFHKEGGAEVGFAVASAAALWANEVEDPSGESPEDLARIEMSYWSDDEGATP